MGKFPEAHENALYALVYVVYTVQDNTNPSDICSGLRCVHSTRHFFSYKLGSVPTCIRYYMYKMYVHILNDAL